MKTKKPACVTRWKRATCFSPAGGGNRILHLFYPIPLHIESETERSGFLIFFYLSFFFKKTKKNKKMVCKHCQGKPTAPGTYSTKCDFCDGKGTRNVCNQCSGIGYTQVVLDLDLEKHDDDDGQQQEKNSYEVLVHQPGEKALVALHCSRCKKSGVHEEDRRVCESCDGKGMLYRPCMASYHLDKVSVR